MILLKVVIKIVPVDQATKWIESFNKLSGQGIRMLVPLFSLLLFRSFDPKPFERFQTLPAVRHWVMLSQDWLHLAETLISFANGIGIVLVIAWAAWELITRLFPKWRLRVIDDLKNGGSYALGWLVFSSAWWWVYYTVVLLINSSSVHPLSSYSRWLTTPALIVLSIRALTYVFGENPPQ